MLDLVILIDHLPPGVLPPGRFVSPDDGSAPVFWLSDQPVAPRIWSQFRSGHDEWKLWPLLLRSDKYQTRTTCLLLAGHLGLPLAQVPQPRAPG